MSYTLSFKDRYLRVAESKVTSDTSQSQQFYFIPDNEEQLIRTKWTGKQWHKLLSCIETGADLMFPDEANEIIWQFIKTITTPPEAPSDNECFEYLPSASFVKFYPDNPYIAGDIKSGWWNEAWFQWQDFFSLVPDWAEDWIGGAVGGLLEYQDTDVLCNIASLAYPTWGAFFDAGGVFPKIEIRFSGTGQINVSLLSFPLGGKAIIELDTEPNILDILTGGVLDPGAFMIELNRDILSFPPQEYPLIVIPIEVTTPGSHVLYINFIPLVNDETTFLGFGGGIRSVELCGFAEVGDVGIEQIFWDGCALKQIVSGIESTIVTADEIQACMDIPDGGGGGGNANVRVTTFDPILTDATTTNIAFTQIDTLFNITPVYSKMLVIVNNFTLAHSAAGSRAEVRIVRDTTNIGTYANVTSVQGTTQRQVTVSDLFENVPVNVSTAFQFQMRVTAAGTATYNNATQMNVTVIEFENVEDLYQQDTRYIDGVLQKKIGGIWLDVVDIDALLAPIQSLASAANTAAAAAQTTANGAVSVNSAQQTVINNHETRLDNLETVDIPQINLTLADHETRIDALEAATSSGGSWAGYKFGQITHIFSAPSFGYYSPSNVYQESAPIGWLPDGSNQVEIRLTNGMRYGAAVHARITAAVHGGSGYLFYCSVNDGDEQQMVQSSTSGNNHFAWLNIPTDNTTEMKIVVRNALGGAIWTQTGVTLLFLVINPLTGVLLP